jgi:hypothetical protein
VCRAGEADFGSEAGRAQRAVTDQARKGTSPVAAQARTLAEADLERPPGREQIQRPLSYTKPG